jgi:hypothetical protein
MQRGRQGGRIIWRNEHPGSRRNNIWKRANGGANNRKPVRYRFGKSHTVAFKS